MTRAANQAISFIFSHVEAVDDEIVDIPLLCAIKYIQICRVIVIGTNRREPVQKRGDIGSEGDVDLLIPVDGHG